MQIDRPIAIAIILFASIILVSILVVPEYKTFKILRVELGEKRAEYKAEFDYYAAITKTYFDLKGRPDDIRKVDNALPQDPNLGQLIYFLQKKAGENGMIVKDLFLSKSSTSTTISGASGSAKDLIFSINLIGDYVSLQSFISALENSARIFEISNISFNTGSQIKAPLPSFQSQINRAYSFNLQIKTYSY